MQRSPISFALLQTLLRPVSVVVVLIMMVVLRRYTTTVLMEIPSEGKFELQVVRRIYF